MSIAYAAPVGSKVAIQISPIESLLQASFIVQLTLLILVGLSVVCWAIIVSKRRQFQVMADANDEFLLAFRKAGSLNDINQHLEKYRLSPLSRVFRAGFVELDHIAQANMDLMKAEGRSVPADQIRLSGIDNLARTLRKAVDNEIMAMEHRLSILATTGSTGPFIGLFGTVWGIMNAFHKIGQTGAASLAVVAPGISEALIATAVGLAAAIPAVVAYNHFIQKLRRQELEISNFSTDLLNLIKRDFFRNE